MLRRTACRGLVAHGLLPALLAAGICRAPAAEPAAPTTDAATGWEMRSLRDEIRPTFRVDERDGHLIHNTAVLIGPDGGLIGRYRKVCLPPGEAAKGVAPGHEYPVFDTAIGRVGLMVCYDGFFPEVARRLAAGGAEVIAWPVWGCNPLLARARAAENRVYVVSSTFMDEKHGWMISAVYDRNGTPIAKGEAWGTVAVVELGRAYQGPWNLGDFRAMLPRHRPPEPGVHEPAVSARASSAPPPTAAAAESR
jgi:hypothetical protein